MNDFEMVPVAPIIGGITFVLHYAHAVVYCTYLLHGAESFLRRNAKPIKDKKKNRKRKYYERITMQAERTHT